MRSESDFTPDPQFDHSPEIVDTHATIQMTPHRMRVLVRALRTCDYSWDHNRLDILELRRMINEGSRK